MLNGVFGIEHLFLALGLGLLVGTFAGRRHNAAKTYAGILAFKEGLRDRLFLDELNEAVGKHKAELNAETEAYRVELLKNVEAREQEVEKQSKRLDLKEREIHNRLMDYRAQVEEQTQNWRKESVLLPGLSRLADLVQAQADKILLKEMLKGKRPAKKSAELVTEAKKEVRQANKELSAVRAQLEMMLAVAPWLEEYREMTVDEILESLRAESAYDASDGGISDSPMSSADSVRRWVPMSEWSKLTDQQKLQRALERYCDPGRRMSLWEVGIRYERYIGYKYESLGYKVEFHGANRGLEDLGVDLICENERHILVVQCKRLSSVKEIPVRENTVSQIYGAAQFLKLTRGWEKPVTPALVTSYLLSEKAKEFASHLGVEVYERSTLESYPQIKCNINSRGEKIYHLPFDQQYDKIVIGDKQGERYAQTVDEAESHGFRHAYRWQGNSTQGGGT